MRVGYIALGVVLIGTVAAAVTADRTLRSVARAEARTAADAAALAGASALTEAPGDAETVRMRALEYVERNSDPRFPTTLHPDEVVFDTEEGTVSLRVEALAYRLPSVLRWLTAGEVWESASATAEPCPEDGAGAANDSGCPASGGYHLVR